MVRLAGGQARTPMIGRRLADDHVITRECYWVAVYHKLLGFGPIIFRIAFRAFASQDVIWINGHEHLLCFGSDHSD